jgi:hypothetical protein
LGVTEKAKETIIMKIDNSALERLAGRPSTMSKTRYEEFRNTTLAMFDHTVKRDSRLRRLVPEIPIREWNGGLSEEYHELRAEYEADLMARARRAAGVYAKFNDSKRERLENLEYYLTSTRAEAVYWRQRNPASVENLWPELEKLREAAKEQKEQDRALAGVVNELREMDRQAWLRPYYDQIGQEAAEAEERQRAEVEAKRKQDALDAWLSAGGKRDEFEKAWPEIFRQMLIADTQRITRHTAVTKQPSYWSAG